MGKEDEKRSWGLTEKYKKDTHFDAFVFELKKDEIAFIPVLSTFARAFWEADILLLTWKEKQKKKVQFSC